MHLKVKAKKNSGLMYLRDTLEQTLKYSQSAYNQASIPREFLPSLGKEIAFTPLLVAAAYNANIFSATEIQVTRKRSQTKGRLDLALFSKKNGRRADLLELKAVRYIVSREINVGINKLQNGIKAAQDQLNDIDDSKISIAAPGKVAVVVQNVICMTDELECEDKVDKYNARFDALFKSVTQELPNSLAGVIKWPVPHKITSSSKKYSSIGLLVVLQRL